MSKRKREIIKRKKLAEDAQPGEGFQSSETTGDVASDGGADAGRTDRRVSPSSEGHVDDSQIVAAREPAAVRRKPARKSKAADPKPVKAAISNSWFDQNKENLLLGLLVFYVFLLGLGTMGELFEVEWVLNLPLFK